MLKRLVRIGRGFVTPYHKEPSDKTVSLLLDEQRIFERCETCRFRSTLTDRCMRIEGPYYRAPVDDTHICDLYEVRTDLDAERVEQRDKLLLIKPRGGRMPSGTLARKMELAEIVSNTPYRAGDDSCCKNCHYDPSGIGYAGCRYPGEVHDLNPIDGGKFCRSWTAPNSK